MSPEVRLAGLVPRLYGHRVTCALILGGTSVPTPDDYYVETVKNQFIAPTHPGQTIDYVAVTTPEEVWPLTGLGRLGCARARAPEPLRAWWPGVAGRAVVETLRALRPHLRSVGPGRGRRSREAMAKHGNDDLVIYGYSQGATRRDPGEAQARRAVPGGNHSPRYRLRAGR